MLKFNEVTKKFGDERPALDNVSFDIDKGELVLITGPSGSGKTTLLKLLTKDIEPTSGEIYFGDQNLTELKRSKVPYHRRKIGAVFQDYKLLPELNVWENIALALSILGHPDKEIEEKVTDLLKLVGLIDKAYLFPHQLSGGEAQRISIARALSTAPQLIFADEPTGNLDAVNSLTVARLLKKINELGTTVIVTTHDPVVIKHLGDAHKMTIEKGVLIDEEAKESKKKSKDEDESKESKVEKRRDEEAAELEPVKSEVAQSEPTQAEPAKPKKHWGFFGIFRNREQSGSDQAQDHDEHHADHEQHDHHDDDHDHDLHDHPVHEHIEVESEDLDEADEHDHHRHDHGDHPDHDDKDQKSKKPKKHKTKVKSEKKED